MTKCWIMERAMAPVGGNKKKLWFSLRLCVCVYAWVFVLPCCMLRTLQLHLDELLFLCCSFFSCRKSWYCFTLHFNFKSPTVLLDHSLMSWRSCQEVQIKVLKWPPPPTHLSWAFIYSWAESCSADCGILWCASKYHCHIWTCTATLILQPHGVLFC